MERRSVRLESGGKGGKRSKSKLSKLSNRSPSGSPAVITYSSKVRKKRDGSFKKQNPCQDNQVFEMLSGALHTQAVTFRHLFRYATVCDMILTGVGVICAIVSAFLYAATLHSFGLFYRFYHNETHPPCWAVTKGGGEALGTDSLYLWLCLAFILFSFLQTFLLESASRRQSKKWELAYLESVFSKEYSWFEAFLDRDVAFRIRNEINEIREAIGETLGKCGFFITASILMLLAPFLLFVVEAAVCLIIAPFFVLTLVFKQRASRKFNLRENSLYKAANKVAETSFAEIEKIKAFCGESKAVKAYESSLYSLKDFRDCIPILAVSAALSWFIPMLSHPFLIWLELLTVGRVDIDDSHGDWKKCLECDASRVWLCPFVPLLGRLDTILLYMTFAVYFISSTLNLVSRTKNAKFLAAEISYCIDWKSEIDNLSQRGRIPRNKVVGEIVLQNVSFNYPVRPMKEVLRRMSLTVHSGQMVVLFGASNSGKATVLKLLLRMYDSCAGSIQLDGMDLHTLNVAWLRSQIGFVPKRLVLYNATIEENICGPLKFSEEEIIKACKKAHIYSYIMTLKNGLQTVVGSRSNVIVGVTQMRKLYLARILLKRCRVILLDEFFSDMSPEEEAEMVGLFENIRDRHTIICTSRKFCTFFKSCDVVYVMKSGEIVQFGNHDNISSIEGYYLKSLQDSLQEEKLAGGVKPYTDSQLGYYKIATAILRMHDIHAEQMQMDYSVLYESEKIVKSVLLRQNARNLDPQLPPRLVGGYYKFIHRFSYEDPYYERRLLRHPLVHNRDLRAKVVPNLDVEGYPEIKENLRIWPMPIEVSIGQEPVYSSLDLVANPSYAGSDLSATTTTTGSFGSFGTEKAVDLVFSESKKQNQVVAQMKFQTRLAELAASGLAKLRHYFGVTINTSVDNNSIRSEDSYLFWNEYSNRITQSTRRRRDPVSCIEFAKLSRYSWPYLVVVCVTSTCMGAALVVSIKFMTDILKLIMEEVLDENILHRLLDLGTLGCIVFFVVFVQETVVCCGLTTLNKFRVSHFAGILEQDIAWFANPRNDVQILCEYLAMDLGAVNTSFTEWVAIGSQTAAILSALMVVVIVDSHQLAEESMALLFIIPFMVGVNFLQGKTRSGKHCNTLKRQVLTLENLLDDCLVQIEDVMAQGLSKHMLEKCKFVEFGKRNSLGHHIRIFGSISMKSTLAALYRANFILAFSLWSVICANQEDYTPEQAAYFISITYLMLHGLFPMGTALALMPSPRVYADSASFIIEITSNVKMKKMSRKNLEKFSLGADMPPPTITFKNVTRVDRNSPEIIGLHNLNFEIPSGTYVAILSSSASAKVTLMQLFVKMSAPCAGTILINDRDIAELDDQSVRRLVAIAEQDPEFTSSWSITENVAYGDNFRTVSQDDIIAACKMALVHDQIEMLPEKYNTKMKDLLTNPKSFAFRQRLSLARAAVRNPKVVVVRDMTVSVDEESDALLIEALVNIRQGRTFIVLSKRIHTIRLADKIVFLNEGTVAEEGTDKDLLNKKGLYYESYMSQMLYEKST